MASILHYTKQDGDGEYIVITDEELATAREEFREPGYIFYASYDLDESGTLPTERSLRAD